MNDDSVPDQTPRKGPHPNLYGGGFTVAVGIIALLIASGYNFGTPRRMGAGFFPTILSCLLILLGGAIAVVRPADERLASLPRLRPILCILGAIIAFGLLVPRIGLVPAIVVSVPIAALAEDGRRVLPTLALAAVIAALVATVFVFALNVPIHLFWW